MPRFRPLGDAGSRWPSHTRTAAPFLNRKPVPAGGRPRPREQPRLGLRQVQAAGALLHVIALLTMFKVYTQLNVLVPGQVEAASDHAAALIRIEQATGLFVEPRFQAWVRDRAVIGVGRLCASLWDCLVYAYAHGHITWLATMLLWVYLFRRRHFAFLAALAHLSTFLAVLLRALYPVSPPRFALSGPPYRMIDATGVPLSEQVYAHFAGFNALGAMPSVHVLWALTTALGLSMCTDRWPTRLACLAFPAVITVSVIATGNHYLLDGVAALLVLAVSALAILAVRSLYGRVLAMPRRAEPSPRPASRLQAAFVLSSLVSVIMLVSNGLVLRVLGAALLIATFCMVVRAAKQGTALPDGPLDGGLAFSGGFLFVAGVTLIDADVEFVRVCGALLWLSTCVPLLAATVQRPEGACQHSHPGTVAVPS